MQAFIPKKILAERAVLHSALTRRIQKRFPDIPFEVVDHLQSYKEPSPITSAKKILALAQYRGEGIKPFPKIRDAINLGDFVFNPVSNCHLECTYCILQSYLRNNPILTLYANWDYFIDSIAKLSEQHSKKVLRVGTGELSDSLALDDLTGLSEVLVPFFSTLPNCYLELKTKSNCIQNLLPLSHHGRTVVSWSLAPEPIIEEEELKCASLAERLDAARQVQAAGFPIGLHLDPLIVFEGWQEAYRNLIQSLARTLDPRRIAWVSLGSLRYDKALKAVATERFPRTKIFSQDLIPAPDGKFRYFKTLRREIYRGVWGLLQAWSEEFPRYLCMEPAWMWEFVWGKPAPAAEAIEASLVNRLEFLRKNLS